MLISKFETEHIEEYILAYEQRHNFKFPEQYREFLLKYNGGDTPETSFRINKVSSDLRGFLGFGKSGESLNYERFEVMNMIGKFLADKVVPIGDNNFGDYVVLGVTGVEKGKIFFLYHDRPTGYIELADDFRSFVSKCKSGKLAYTPTIEERTQSCVENGFTITDVKIKSWQADIDKYGNMKQEELVL